MNAINLRYFLPSTFEFISPNSPIFASPYPIGIHGKREEETEDRDRQT